ncbi:U3 small nucleolar RNA-associated protein 4 [Colletotrichum gloeosporioides]|uniref:U3 small nucleolar RNA-associated protein 4 n=1 Tax=Colletotrichum gloeosporioides TaxID=474922 RepID=A0A8H4CL87_COLGL|nr:U3 small nucleolar RNA-associated protein 4 [Colletotrichum gloeosporioides]KAF3805901.1 U3 small nucleolar RNA-associated protein 4 [Colletotrichum gloeosporioides]
MSAPLRCVPTRGGWLVGQRGRAERVGHTLSPLPFVGAKVPLGQVHLPQRPLDEDGLERGGAGAGERRYAQDRTVLVRVPPAGLAGAVLGLRLRLLLAAAERGEAGLGLFRIRTRGGVVGGVRVRVDVHRVRGGAGLDVVLPLLGALGRDEAVDLRGDDGADGHFGAGAGVGALALALGARGVRVDDDGGVWVGDGDGGGEVLGEVEHEEEVDAVDPDARALPEGALGEVAGLADGRGQAGDGVAAGPGVEGAGGGVEDEDVPGGCDGGEGVLWGVAGGGCEVRGEGEDDGGSGEFGEEGGGWVADPALRGVGGSIVGVAVGGGIFLLVVFSARGRGAEDPGVDVAGQVGGGEHAAVRGEGEVRDGPLVAAEAAVGLVLGDVAAEAGYGAGLLDSHGAGVGVARDARDEDLGAVLHRGEPGAVRGEDDLAGAVGGEGGRDGDGGDGDVGGLGGVAVVAEVEGLEGGRGGDGAEGAVGGDGGGGDGGVAVDEYGLEELAVGVEVLVLVGGGDAVAEEAVEGVLQLPDLDLVVPPVDEQAGVGRAGEGGRLGEVREGSVVLATEFFEREDDGGGVGAFWGSLTSCDDDADAPALERGHGLDVVLVVFPAPDLAPSGAVAGGLLVEDGAAVHAAAHDGGAVGAGGQAEGVLAMALDALRLGRLDAPDDDVGAFPGAGVLAVLLGTDGHLAEAGAALDVVDAERRVGAADDEGVARLEGDADHLDLLGGGLDEDALEAQLAVLDGVEGEDAVDGAGDEAGDGVGGRGWGLGGEAPDVAVLAGGVAQGPAGLEVPFGDGGGVADAEEARAAWDGGAAGGGGGVVGVGHPDEAVDGAVCAGAEDGLLEPGAIEGVPDLDVAVRAADGEAREGGVLLRAGGGVGEGEGVDGGGRVRDEAAAVEVHCGVWFGLLAGATRSREGIN